MTGRGVPPSLLSLVFLTPLPFRQYPQRQRFEPFESSRCEFAGLRFVVIELSYKRGIIVMIPWSDSWSPVCQSDAKTPATLGCP